MYLISNSTCLTSTTKLIKLHDLIDLSYNIQIKCIIEKSA